MFGSRNRRRRCLSGDSRVGERAWQWTRLQSVMRVFSVSVQVQWICWGYRPTSSIWSVSGEGSFLRCQQLLLLLLLLLLLFLHLGALNRTRSLLTSKVLHWERFYEIRTVQTQWVVAVVFNYSRCKAANALAVCNSLLAGLLQQFPSWIIATVS